MDLILFQQVYISWDNENHRNNTSANKKEEALDCNNYRPTSQISNLSKIF